MTPDGLSRRHALAGAATLGLGAAALAACGNDSSSSAEPPAADETSSGSGDDTGNDTGSGTGGDTGAAALATTDQIAVGGGVVFGDQQVVVTQPKKGDFRGFSAVCTHQGCLVGEVSGGTINCPCHDSRFSVDDGSVESGPATSPLSEVRLDVRGNKINLA